MSGVKALVTIPLRMVLGLVGFLIVSGITNSVAPQYNRTVYFVMLVAALLMLFRPFGPGLIRGRSFGLGALLCAFLLAGQVFPAKNVGEMAGVGGSGRASTRVAAKTEDDFPPWGVDIEPATVSSNPLHDETKQALWIEATKDHVRAKMKDPDSVAFREVFFNAYQGKTPVVCGNMNAKNGFGGYSGFQRFIASGDSIMVLETAMQGKEFAKTWKELCQG